MSRRSQESCQLPRVGWKIRGAAGPGRAENGRPARRGRDRAGGTVPRSRCYDWGGRRGGGGRDRPRKPWRRRGDQRGRGRCSGWCRGRSSFPEVGIDLLVFAAELVEDGIVHPGSDDLAEVTLAVRFEGDGGGQGFNGDLLGRLALGLGLFAQVLLELVGDVAEDQGHVAILQCLDAGGEGGCFQEARRSHLQPALAGIPIARLRQWWMSLFLFRRAVVKKCGASRVSGCQIVSDPR